MARYDPQRAHARPKVTDDEPAPVERLLGVEPDTASAPETNGVAEPNAPAPARPSAAPTPLRPPPTEASGAGPAKLVGIGLGALAVVLLVLRLRRRRRSGRAD